MIWRWRRTFIPLSPAFILHCSQQGPLCEEPLYETFEEMMEGLQEADSRLNKKRRSTAKVREVTATDR